MGVQGVRQNKRRRHGNSYCCVCCTGFPGQLGELRADIQSRDVTVTQEIPGATEEEVEEEENQAESDDEFVENCLHSW